MPRYFAKCAYQGTDYSGWQKQINATTVQGRIEEKLSLIFKSHIEVVGCGRTDAGVHASEYYFHFDVPEILGERLVYSIKSIMPRSIAIHDLIPVDDSSHARFDAVSRRYRYQIRLKYSPFQNEYYHTLKGIRDFDTSRLKTAADFILELEDFEAFSKKGSEVNHHRCEMYESYWEHKGDELFYVVRANRFLRGMVRLLVGMQLNYAYGKFTLEELKTSIRQSNSLILSYSVPAAGLFLDEIRYPKSLGITESLP